MKRAIILLLLTASVVAATAKAADVAQRATLTQEGAQALAEAAVKYARSHAAPGAAVAVVDSAGMLMHLIRLDGTFENAASISIGKARTAVLFGKPTRVFEDSVNKGRYSMLAVPEVAPFTPLMGGVPVEAEGRIVGAIGVSGAASAAQDDEIASAAAAEFAGRQATGGLRVSYVPGSKVEAAFQHEGSLIEGPRYRVSASRRQGPGEAEIHVEDADIFYVLHGHAELVVGGDIPGARHLTNDELRGTEIKGGDVYQLSPGDVMSIPRGTPHWFRQVRGDFKYFVVKSTG